jgi:hypothetical protein
LKKKKLNIFIKNKINKAPVDYVGATELTEFFGIVTDSYIWTLRHSNNTFTEEWENMCNKELFLDKLTEEEKKNINKYIKNMEFKQDQDVCVSLVNKKLTELYKTRNTTCTNTSTPKKSNKTNKGCISVNANENVEFCSFTGITLDILMGLIYLLKKHSSACTPISDNFVTNKELCTYYKTIGIVTNTRCEFLNFEIVWVYKKLFFSNNFVENFKKCLGSKKRFIIIPLGIEMKEGGHANYLIYDNNKKEIERFEPYGSSPPYRFNYNSQLLDNILTYKFNEIDNNIKYIKPSTYMPKISFQYLESYESKTKNIGDPGGFCALWSIWYTDMRLSYPDIERTSLVKKLIKEIRMNNVSFKNLIRNYSTNVTNTRDNVFKNVNITINDWLNDKYTDAQLEKLIKQISNNIKQLI